jgi:single-stranded DNA-binding protein
VYIEGRLKTDKYEDQTGETKYYTKVVAQTVQFLSDNRAGDKLMDEFNGIEEEDLFPEVP